MCCYSNTVENHWKSNVYIPIADQDGKIAQIAYNQAGVMEGWVSASFPEFAVNETIRMFIANPYSH
jgi:hypothetical protein